MTVRTRRFLAILAGVLYGGALGHAVGNQLALTIVYLAPAMLVTARLMFVRN